MNLFLNILWFDDAPGFFDSLDVEPFKREVVSWGFDTNIELVTTADEFMKRKPWAQYDLIVVDYNLGRDDIHGEDFIRRIREQQVFTEIIFYTATASSALWDAIQKRQLEGVFVSDKQGILQKLERVARQSIHKVLDLNNMRGIVMAEVGDIDQIIDSIVRIGVAELKPDKQAKFFDRFHGHAEEQGQDGLKRLKEFKGDPTLDTMLSLCDSYKRWMNFKRLVKQHARVKEFEGGDYNQDVLRPRNHLAHGTVQIVGGATVFTYQGSEYRFDEQESQSLRKKILDYRRKFVAIREKLVARRT